MFTAQQLALVKRKIQQGKGVVEVQVVPIRSRAHPGSTPGYALIMECRRLNLRSKVFSFAEFQSLLQLWMDLVSSH
jgi:hypothetical protein